MILKEYSIPEKNKLAKLIEYLQPLVPEEELEKILDFYQFYDISYYEIEDIAVFEEFFSHLKKLAKKNSITIPEEFQ